MTKAEFIAKFNVVLAATNAVFNTLENLKTQDVADIKDLTDSELEAMGWPVHIRPYLLKVLDEIKDLPTPFLAFKGALQDVIDAAGGLLG